MAVAMKPGATALMVMLREANSRARDLVRPMRPALEAAYLAWPAEPVSPTTEVMLMTRPQRAFIMLLMTAWVRRKLPVRLARRMSSKSASFMRRARPSRVMPALLTRMWQAPRSARTDLAQDLMESSDVTSRAKALAVPPAEVILE